MRICNFLHCPPASNKLGDAITQWRDGVAPSRDDVAPSTQSIWNCTLCSYWQFKLTALPQPGWFKRKPSRLTWILQQQACAHIFLSTPLSSLTRIDTFYDWLGDTTQRTVFLCLLLFCLLKTKVNRFHMQTGDTQLSCTSNTCISFMTFGSFILPFHPPDKNDTSKECKLPVASHHFIIIGANAFHQISWHSLHSTVKICQ